MLRAKTIWESHHNISLAIERVDQMLQEFLASLPEGTEVLLHPATTSAAAFEPTVGIDYTFTYTVMVVWQE